MKKAYAAAKGAKKAAGPYKMAPPVPEGTVVTDLMKNQWKIGPPVGSGGFGLIYLTKPASLSGPVTDGAEHVLKMEPFDNGPLFCELAFFQRAAKPEKVKEYMRENRLKCLGVPDFLGTGQHMIDDSKYRFMVIQRFRNDLQKLFEQNQKRFPASTVFLVALQVLDVLEYIHKQGYAHADIKAANIMTGLISSNQVYLIDYGLAFRFNVDGKHKEYKIEPKDAHNGTAEFASRDAHRGVRPSARGDLEILGYCMWQWLTGKLPWENNLENKEYVASTKIKYMDNINGLIAPLITDQLSSKALCTYLRLVNDLAYDQTPSYDEVRQIFKSVLKQLKSDGRLIFSSGAGASIMSPGPKRRSMASIARTGRVKAAVDKIETAKKPKQADASRSRSPKAPGTSRARLFSPSPPSRAPSKGRVAKATEVKKPVGSKRGIDMNKLNADLASPPPKTIKKASPLKPNRETSSRKRKRAEPAYCELSNGEEDDDGAIENQIVRSPIRKKPTIKPALPPRPTARPPIVRIKPRLEAGTQTSPGLKGLPRSWKK